MYRLDTFLQSAYLRGMDKQALKDWRKGHGMTQIKAAELLEVSLATYKRWEKGDPQQYPKLLELACQAVDNPLDTVSQ